VQLDDFDDEMLSGGVYASFIVIFFGLLFALFTAVMLCEQISNIVSNTTGIECMQRKSLSPPRPWMDSMQEVMGRGPSWSWLLPTLPRTSQIKDNT